MQAEAQRRNPRSCALPYWDVDNLISAQARRKAEALVANASDHMALELQSLPDEKNRAEVERIAADLVRTMPADFWANG